MIQPLIALLLDLLFRKDGVERIGRLVLHACHQFGIKGRRRNTCSLEIQSGPINRMIHMVKGKVDYRLAGDSANGIHNIILSCLLASAVGRNPYLVLRFCVPQSLCPYYTYQPIQCFWIGWKLFQVIL